VTETRALKRSGSSGDILRRRCPEFRLAPLPATPPGEAWRTLSTSLIKAFETSAEVTPDHPAAACIKGLDAAALTRDLFHSQCWMKGAYTRTTVLQGDGFEAMLLCWPPQTCSPVHAHSDAESGVKSNCFMAILEGELYETLYGVEEVDGDRVIGEGRKVVLRAGASHYINDDFGVHKVGNSSPNGAVSLHVYAPGWNAVQIFAEEPVDASGAPINTDGWGDF